MIRLHENEANAVSEQKQEYRTINNVYKNS